jgi:cytochrome P450
VTTAADTAPYFDSESPGFAIKSEQVYQARERSWYARTSYGLAVLRYDETRRLLNHPKLRQGSVAWPAHNGITEGPFADWWASWVLNKEGEEHHRLRRPMNPAFDPRAFPERRFDIEAERKPHFGFGGGFGGGPHHCLGHFVARKT